MLLWLAPAFGLSLMAASCVAIANTGDYKAQAMLERGDPYYSASQISGAIAPLAVFLWAGLITTLMVITVVLPMQSRQAGPPSTSDKAFTIAAIVSLVVPMGFLTWLAISEGAAQRGIGYLYQPWYVPTLIAGTALYGLALVGALVIPRSK
jgi:hypothetical protein